jgi:hypothetical protein
MKPAALITLCAAAITFSSTALADPHKGGHGHGKHKHTEVYWDGHCKVERKWKGNGDYKEKRKCDHHAHAPVVVQQPVVVQHPVVVQQPVVVQPVVVEPGLVIHGTVRVK